MTLTQAIIVGLFAAVAALSLFGICAFGREMWQRISEARNAESP